jgi:peroxiredoxin Q/BCP
MGDPAPAFMLQDQSGRVRQLSEYRGSPVVLYFYPRDATPGCTAEACAFRDAWAQLQETGAVVLGVSTDDVESHRRFHEEHQLPFDLLADVDGEVAQRYGVPMQMGMSSRITFLIDGEGVVRRVFEDVDPAVHADEVIAAIQALPASTGGGTGVVPQETPAQPSTTGE